MIFSKHCDDPESMVILDLITGKTYTQEEALKETPEVRSRLVNHCTKRGYGVFTIEEIYELQENGNKKKIF